MFYYTIQCSLEPPKLAHKNDTQPNKGGEEILLHFLPKPHLEQQKFKTYLMFQYELVVKNFTCLVLMLPTCSTSITPLLLWIPSLKSLLCEREIIITKPKHLFLLINLCNIL